MNRSLCIHSRYKSITYRAQTVFWLRELGEDAVLAQPDAERLERFKAVLVMFTRAR